MPKLQSTLRLLVTEDQSLNAPAVSGQRPSLTYDAYNLVGAVEDENTDPTQGNKIDVPIVDESFNASHLIDLTAARLARDQGVVTDLTGKSLVGMVFWTPDTNAGNVTIAPASTNGYSKCPTYTSCPGSRLALRTGKSSGPGVVAVSPTEKDIQVTVALGGDIFNLLLVFGSPT